MDAFPDSDGDYIPDWWEIMMGLDPNDWTDAEKPDPNRPWYNYYESYLVSLAPDEFTFEILSGNNQSAVLNSFTNSPIRVRVYDRAFKAINGATVTFEVIAGGCKVNAARDSGSTGGTSVPVTTTSGTAGAYLRTGPTTDQVRVRATMTRGGTSKSVVFSSTTRNELLPPAAPTDIAAVRNVDDSYTITWSDNAFDEDQYVISEEMDDGTWVDIATLPPNTTTHHVAAQP